MIGVKEVSTKLTRLVRLTTLTLFMTALFAMFNYSLSADLYKCELSKYRASGGSKKALQSWVPSELSFELNPNGVVLITDNWQVSGQITKNTDTRVEFSVNREVEDSRGRETTMRYRVVHFYTNNKIAVYARPKGYNDLGEAWGICDEKKIPNAQVQTSKEAEVNTDFSATVFDLPSYESTNLDFTSSKYIQDNYWNSKSKKTFKKLKGTNKLQMWMGPPPCPTASWWQYPKKSQASVVKWQKSVEKRLKGYPKKTVEFCKNPVDVIVNGKATTNPINKNFYSRLPSSMIIRKDGKGNGERVIIENDYLGDRTGGAVYDKNLQQICSFVFLSKTSLNMTCKKIGNFKAKFEIKNLFKGEFILVGGNEAYQVFGTNLSLEKAKSKYPKIF